MTERGLLGQGGLGLGLLAALVAAALAVQHRKKHSTEGEEDEAYGCPQEMVADSEEDDEDEYGLGAQHRSVTPPFQRQASPCSPGDPKSRAAVVMNLSRLRKMLEEMADTHAKLEGLNPEASHQQLPERPAGCLGAVQEDGVFPLEAVPQVDIACGGR
eukprot:gnl/TRDRNA2_/TRDRNA2_138219_c0_seq2.p1 gnl/TRDRNA2_/TRDRNA2_138219_c0~~gnl/TRDRNA2_/TRDRNA2_138219_c0_seq2.p1  ORF type:complete len:158 (+),score=32.06 gnl/TRDRNA2_/TRDRNA2_138219_c0_seq2:130-603(+)